jgi:maltooligosyltrehalose trehalohydrolase
MSSCTGPKITGAGVAFCLWAPDAQSVALSIANQAPLPMQRDEHGVFSITTQTAAGAAYMFRIDDATDVPDPASHAQQDDVHGASLVVDHDFSWKNSGWRGRPWVETVIYELHPGAFGGFAGITAQLPRLAALGVTAIELMPIADFPGKRNWGYDGVLPYAPDTAYGTPAELKLLIDTAHGLNLQVFLDVVYNHFGPDGNFLNVYAKSFFREDEHTPWGNAIDFRRPQVREFFIGNALYWLTTYRFDGLRFDAVHAICDSTFLEEMAEKIRTETEGRHVHLVLENEHNDATLLRTDDEIQKYDAQWADDFHHCVHVLLTGESEGYYEDFQDAAKLLARCLAEGFAYQGEHSPHQGKPRGTDASALPGPAFVICLQNHDQIGNRAMGERLRVLAHPDALRAATLLLLLTPQIPMIFMGEEFGETRPFLFFTDHHDELGRLVTEGRRKEFAHFEAFQNPETRENIPDPNAAGTFTASIPEFTENDWTALYKTALELRRSKIVPHLAGCTSVGAEALSPHAVRAAWRLNDNETLTIVSNFSTLPTACAPVEGELLIGPGLSDGTATGLTTSVWIAS